MRMFIVLLLLLSYVAAQHVSYATAQAANTTQDLLSTECCQMLYFINSYAAENRLHRFVEFCLNLL